jgi:hypothetical protein
VVVLGGKKDEEAEEREAKVANPFRSKVKDAQSCRRIFGESEM